MNTNSNIYTIIYASIMVVIVAFLLAFVSSSLKDRQNKNVELDKMKQILSSLNISAEEMADDAEAVYNKYVKADQILDKNGNVVAENGGFKIESKCIADQLPLYVCEVNGETKYVAPLYGAGLWGPVWGYVSFNADKQTIYGTYFSHEGETPGLGAEIATPAFQSQFKGKTMQENGEVKISVAKHGKVTDANTQVDGISGGTITSKGVDKMLHDCLGKYAAFFQQTGASEVSVESVQVVVDSASVASVVDSIEALVAEVKDSLQAQAVEVK